MTGINGYLLHVLCIIPRRIQCRSIHHIKYEARCILTGIHPINIRAEEAATLYNITGRIIQKYQIDKEENPRNWLHPADTVKVNDIASETTDDREDSKHNIHVYTDGSRSEHGVGSGIVIYKDDKITHEEIQIRRTLFKQPSRTTQY